MYRGKTISLSFPPFTPWVKRIVIACAGIYFLEVVMGAVAPRSGFGEFLGEYFRLIPSLVMSGYVWQLVTYSLLHGGLWHLLTNMLTLWMFGSQEEQDWGSRRFIEFYLFCVVGAALVTIAVAYLGWGMTPDTATLGASGGIYGILIAFGMLYGDRELFLFPLPVAIKAKYLVGILMFIVLISAFQPSQGGVANFAHLGGALFGFLYIKLLPKRGLGFAASERYFSLRNSYYRWKRKKAAKKFEVYMRDHDRKVTFDEHGNYVPPDENDKTNGGSKSGWVN
ncbi:MAG TPA: rhomboid family intramembrane serine protease [Terriglobales bacterium]|jgi:membrane associated rhomboid family serine protease|nr:rhomboid family intramembrane serine protease [Terriglobales bacterium]